MQVVAVLSHDSGSPSLKREVPLKSSFSMSRLVQLMGPTQVAAPTQIHLAGVPYLARDSHLTVLKRIIVWEFVSAIAQLSTLAKDACRAPPTS